MSDSVKGPQKCDVCGKVLAPSEKYYIFDVNLLITFVPTPPPKYKIPSFMLMGDIDIAGHGQYKIEKAIFCEKDGEPIRAFVEKTGRSITHP